MDVTTPSPQHPGHHTATLTDDEQALTETMDGIAKLAAWRPPLVEIDTPAALQSLPADAFGVSEQGGFFLKGQDGRFYEPGSALSHGAEDLALPFTLHGCLGAAASPLEDPELS